MRLTQLRRRLPCLSPLELRALQCCCRDQKRRTRPPEIADSQAIELSKGCKVPGFRVRKHAARACCARAARRRGRRQDHRSADAARGINETPARLIAAVRRKTRA